jgi:hypothetical protein
MARPEIPLGAIANVFKANDEFVDAILNAAEASVAAADASKLPEGWLYAYTISDDMHVLSPSGEYLWASQLSPWWEAIGVGHTAVARDLLFEPPHWVANHNSVHMKPLEPTARFRKQQKSALTILLGYPDFENGGVYPIHSAEAHALRDQGKIFDPSLLKLASVINHNTQ